MDFEYIATGAQPIKECFAQTPFLDEWKTVTVLLGAFPEDLVQIERNSQFVLPRADWLAFQDFARSNRRRPVCFGDYNIGCGKFKEHEGKRRNFSASLRYTSQDHWVIMRGEGVFNEDDPGFDQYPAQAQLLCDREEFSGPEFCFGDKYIYEMAQQASDTGSAKTWLEATINHHLTFVQRQVAGSFAA